MEEFPEKIREGWCLIVFTASWCPHGSYSDEGLVRDMEAFAETLRVFKCDVDESAELAKKLGVYSIPVSIVFECGQEAARFVGPLKDNKLLGFLEKKLRS